MCYTEACSETPHIQEICAFKDNYLKYICEDKQYNNNT